MEKITVPVLVCCFILLFSYREARYTERDRQEKFAIALECIDQVGIDRAIIEKAMASAVLPKNDTKYKEFLTCSYKRQGYQSADGEILLDNIKEFLANFYNASDLSVLDPCNGVKAGNEADTAFNVLACIIPKLEQLEVVNNTIQ